MNDQHIRGMATARHRSLVGRGGREFPDSPTLVGYREFPDSRTPQLSLPRGMQKVLQLSVSNAVLMCE